MKKNIKSNLIALALASATILSLGSVSDVLAANRVVKLQIGNTTAYTNGVSSTLDAVPYQDSSYNTMVPVRFIATALGISDDNIDYDWQTQKVTIQNGNTTIEFTVGNTQLTKTTITQSGNITLNDMLYLTMPTAAVIIDGRTYVPVRAVSEAFGVDVDWDQNTKTVTLTDNSSNTNININTNASANTNVSLEDLLSFPGVDMSFSFPTGTQIITSQPQTQIITQTQIVTSQPQTIQQTTARPTTTTEATTQTTTAQTTTTTPSKDTSTARQFEEEVVKLVNVERAKEGLSPLEIDETAMSQARAKSQDMVDRNYFSHEDPVDGSFMYEDLMNYFYGAAENIAYGQRTPSEVVDAWMNSPGHKANILTEKFEYIGVGFVDYKWTQMFGGSRR